MNPNVNLRRRQVHLDFHTSEHCPDVGADFDEEQFINCLQFARVNSVTVFGQCHHGWCYYPTRTGWQHPHLKTDLLGRMLAAGRQADINMPVYLTVQWNDKASREHPEWIVRRPDGTVEGPPPMHPHTPKGRGWYRLCTNSPYTEEVLLVLVREVMEMYNPSGLFLDITGEHSCLCDWCVASMRDQGLDPGNADDQATHARKVYQDYLRKTSEIVWGLNPDATLYHNSSDKKGRRDLYGYWSHYEIESLPTGMWGYNHFPVNARYFTGLPDCDVLSQTGKFHTAWGEFGGFKNPVALRYEVGQIVSLGCKCMVGDQLHPRGRLDEETYRIIGEAYRRVEEREPWLEGARPVADVAVLAPSAVRRNRAFEVSENGAGQMLMEAHLPFAVLDGDMDFSPYRLLVLPDHVLVDDALEAKLTTFLGQGGALLLSGESGLDPGGERFRVDTGTTFAGRSPWDVEYVVVGDRIADGLVRSPFLVYAGGMKTTVNDAEVLAEAWNPYFNRTYGRFCSHRNTPYEGPAGWPAVTRKGRILHVGPPIFRCYKEKGMQLHRDLVLNCLDLLLPERLVRVEGLPSCGRVSLMRQPDQGGRLVLHVMYAAPIKRGDTEVIEDIVTLHDLEVSIRCEREPRTVYLAPERTELTSRWKNGVASFTLPPLYMNQIVVVE